MEFENSESIFFHYIFKFKTGNVEEIRIEIEPETLRIIDSKQTSLPYWTDLKYHTCSNCQLLEQKNVKACPIAVNLTEIIPIFKGAVSYDEVNVRVITKERTYESDCSVQRGLSSLLGIIMVTSGCPTMEILKPMVRFHLPFATIDETIFRSATSYLLAQFYRYRAGLTPDWEMEGLLHSYEDIQDVNVGMADRMRSVSEKDANINAVVILDIFARDADVNC